MHEVNSEIPAAAIASADVAGVRNWPGLNLIQNTRALAIGVFLFSTAIMFTYRPLSRMELGDPAIYDYIAQSILRGQIPYRDTVDIKGPGAAYLSAAAILIGKAVGVRDIIAIRLLYVMLVGVLAVLMFLVGELYFHSRLAGLLAVPLIITQKLFAATMLAGTQPKLPMLVFGLLALVMIAKDRPFLAGVCSMASCLFWQPGLMYFGVAFLMFSRYLTSWRDLKAVKVIAGAVVTLIPILAYFYAKHVLGDMWAWTITYNYGTFGPAGLKPPGEAAGHIWRVLNRQFANDVILVWLSILGLLAFGFERLRMKFRAGTLKSADLFRDAVFMPPMIYLGFSLINFQGAPDLIPFFPFIGLFAAWAVVRLASLIKPTRSVGIMGVAIPIRSLAPALLVSIALLFVLVRDFRNRTGGWDLSFQDSQMKRVAALLGPGDKMYAHGGIEALVLLNIPNANPYVFLDWGADDFLAGRKHTTFQAVIDEIESDAPKVAMVSRLGAVRHREDYERWLKEHYDSVEDFEYGHLFVRKPQ